MKHDLNIAISLRGEGASFFESIYKSSDYNFSWGYNYLFIFNLGCNKKTTKKEYKRLSSSYRYWLNNGQD